MSDDRPRPQFGELAPPGWSWTPPSDPHEDPVEEVAPEPVSDEPATLARTPMQRRDLTYTIALLAFGVVIAARGLPDLLNLTQALNNYYALQGMGAYGGGDAAQTAGVTAAILHVVILLATIGVSAWLISRRKLAFYVPLIGGALALIVYVVCLFAAIVADPTFPAQYSSL